MLIRHVFAQDGQTNDRPSTSATYLYNKEIPGDKTPTLTFAPKYVFVTFINEHYSGFTYSNTVGEALNDLDIELRQNHVVKPSVEFTLSDNQFIRIQEVRKKVYVETQSIPFESMSISDPTKELYTSYVKQTGRKGLKEITYEQTFVNGILEKTRQVDEVVKLRPQDEIIAVGTKVVPTENVSACKEKGSSFWTEYILSMKADETEKDWLLCVSACESGRRNCRVSSNGIYYGIMQYSVASFTSAGGTSIWNGGEQLDFALAVYRAGRAGSTWPACNTMCK